jgi:predicted metal-binding membrane protein
MSAANEVHRLSPGARIGILGIGALLFIASAAATIYWCNSMSGGMAMPGGWTMSMTWMRMQGQSWFDAASSFLGMWVVMMAAMMLPVLIPALLRYRLSLREPQSTHLATLTTLAGAAYAFVWALIGAAVYPIGVVLSKTVMASEVLARLVPTAVGMVLLLAGYLQVTKWKVRQICRCRAESAGGRAQHRDARGAWHHGIRLGVDCALCCSGLVAVVLVTGVMNLGTMALVTVAVAAERLMPRPERAARTTGVVIIAAAVFMIGRGLAAYWSG